MLGRQENHGKKSPTSSFLQKLYPLREQTRSHSKQGKSVSPLSRKEGTLDFSADETNIAACGYQATMSQENLVVPRAPVNRRFLRDDSFLAFEEETQRQLRLDRAALESSEGEGVEDDTIEKSAVDTNSARNRLPGLRETLIKNTRFDGSSRLLELDNAQRAYGGLRPTV